MGAQDYLNLLKITVDKKLKKKVVSEVSPTENAQLLLENKLSSETKAKLELLKKRYNAGEFNINSKIKQAEEELEKHLNMKGTSGALNDKHTYEILKDKVKKLKNIKTMLISGGIAATAIGVNRAIKHRKAEDIEDRLKEDTNLESVNRQAILDFLNDNIEIKDFMKVTEGRFYDKWRNIKKSTKHKVKPLVRRTSAQWMLKHKNK